jgi:hypothetical protein
MHRFRRGLIVALGVAALAVPAGAAAKKGDHQGKAKGHGPHNVAYVFKGVYAGEGSIEVKKGNSRVRKGGFVGDTVAFDLSGARIVVGDTNSDGSRNLEDVEVGDWVLVKARLPRQDAGDQPFEAKKLIDKTHNPGKKKGSPHHP